MASARPTGSDQLADQNPGVAGRYGIRSIPSMFLFKNGQVVEQLVGAMPKPAILKKIEGHLPA